MRIDTGPPLSENVASAQARGGRGAPSAFENRAQLASSGVERQASFIGGEMGL
jgi:hypothetical protein